MDEFYCRIFTQSIQFSYTKLFRDEDNTSFFHSFLALSLSRSEAKKYTKQTGNLLHDGLAIFYSLLMLTICIQKARHTCILNNRPVSFNGMIPWSYNEFSQQIYYFIEIINKNRDSPAKPSIYYALRVYIYCWFLLSDGWKE